MAVMNVWLRRCWICNSEGACGHREPELVHLWRQPLDVAAEPPARKEPQWAPAASGGERRAGQEYGEYGEQRRAG